MKVSKKTGKVRLEENEVRIGNFFVKRDAESMKICDLNLVFMHRVSRRMPVGIWLENVCARANNGEEVSLNTLKTYIATLWSAFSVAPDDEYISDLLSASRAALERHPDWYGVKADATDAEHEEAAKDVKEMKEFEEDVKKLADADTSSPAE